jgi:AraC family transcriptional regulator
VSFALASDGWFLANTSMTIEAIALKSGYASVPAFSRAFQADYEMPPAQYRDNGAHASFRMSSQDAMAADLLGDIYPLLAR